MKRSERSSLWRWPAGLALLTIAGLLTALTGGPGPARWFCWITLSIPLAAVAWHVRR